MSLLPFSWERILLACSALALIILTGVAARPKPTAKSDLPMQAKRPFVEASLHSVAAVRIAAPFEPNVGQSAHDVKFLSRGSESTVLLTAQEAVLVFWRHPSTNNDATESQNASPLRMRWLGANKKAEIAGVDLQAGHSNYMIGKEPARWRTFVPNYRSVRYRNLYPGIDFVYHARNAGHNALEYDFVIGPGADPGLIRLEFQGQRSLRINSSGGLELDLGGESITQLPPLAYQEIGGGRVLVEASYLRQASGVVSFQLGPYDRGKPLVIDPSLVLSSYLGGTRNDGANAVATDPAGNIYLAGATTSPDFPTSHAMEPNYHGDFSNPIASFCHPFDSPFSTPCPDAFVAKLDPSGNLIYSTYLGGGGWDQAMGIAADAAGNAYVTGSSTGGFPLANAFQGTFGGNRPGQPMIGDAFVAKLDPTGSKLVYSTYLGGSFDDLGAAIQVDGGGNAYIAGWTSSWNFPVRNAIQSMNNITNPVIGSSAFAAKLDTGGGLVWSTYLGGSGTINDKASAIALDAAGAVYIAGQASSSDFPTTPGALQTAKAGTINAFVAKISPAGTSLVYSTYLGGSNQDGANGIAVDVLGGAYIAGFSNSADFPTHQPIQGGLVASTCSGSPCQDAVIAELNPAGSGLVFSTYLGGKGADFATAIAVSPAGALFVAGWTTSPDFPTTPDALPISGAGLSDAFLLKIQSQPPMLLYSTYLGGSDADVANGLALDGAGDVIVAGSTASPNFPTAGAFQASLGGVNGDFGVARGDAFVAKFSTDGDPPPPPPLGVPTINPGGVVNGASFAAGAPVAPGSIVSVFGDNLGVVSFAGGLPLPTTLGVSQADAGSMSAPLFFTSPQQINLQVPWELQGQAQTSLVASSDGESSGPQAVSLASFAPGIFTISQNGSGQGAVLISNTQILAAPSGSIPGRDSRPAQRGEFISIYCTGLGAVSNPPPSGYPAMSDPLSSTVAPISVNVGGVVVPAAFAGLAPGFVGLYQVDFQVPQSVPSGAAVPLWLSIGGITSNNVIIAVN